MSSTLIGPRATPGGIPAAGSVHCIDLHDGACAIWRNAGVKGRVLVHVDAHHDLYGGWIDKQRPERPVRINIANFLFAALDEGLVREVIWVVPDDSWATQANRRDIVNVLRRITQESPAAKPRITVSRDRILGTALGHPIQVCTVDNLPPIGEAVLLDIDVDYLVIPNTGYRNIGVYGHLPWCWPPELLSRLAARGIHADLTTIATSVEGGYTPLQWKYLGEELKQRLDPGAQDMAWADCMRRAAVAAALGDFHSAEAEYRTAHRLHPGIAAPYFHLAHLCAATGRPREGRDFLQQAYALDPSYRTPYNNAGLWYLGNRRDSQARRAFERALVLDPQDSSACLGCGLVAIQAKDWTGAERWLRQALSLDDADVDAHRALGRVLARRRDYPGAIAAYERSLKLVLSGHRSIGDESSLSMLDDGGTPWDSDHGVVHAELARLLAAEGDWKSATAGYRMAIALGIDTAEAWVGLAEAYIRTRRGRLALAALRHAGRCAPGDLMRWGKRQWARCRRGLESWRRRRSRAALASGPPGQWI